MPMPREAAVGEWATGPWRPTWSGGRTRPDLPPLTVVHDRGDDYAFMAAALAAHTPASGRITVHPTPVAGARASPAHGLLRSMGKHLLAHRLHARIAHPVHAAALALRILTGRPATQLPTRPHRWPGPRATASGRPRRGPWTSSGQQTASGTWTGPFAAKGRCG